MENDENVKTCWICFGSSDEDKAAEWVKPCKCRGTVKWVHQNCLQRWVDVKVNGFSKVACNRCGVKYIIQCPCMGYFVTTFENLYEFAVRSSRMIVFIVQISRIPSRMMNDVICTNRNCIRVIRCFPDRTEFERLLSLAGFFLFVAAATHLWRLENKIAKFLGQLTVKNREYEFPREDVHRWTDDFFTNFTLMPVAAKIFATIVFDDFKKNAFRKAMISVGVVSSFKFFCNVSYKYLQLIRSNRRRIVDYVE